MWQILVCTWTDSGPVDSRNVIYEHDIVLWQSYELHVLSAIGCVNSLRDWSSEHAGFYLGTRPVQRHHEYRDFTWTWKLRQYETKHKFITATWRVLRTESNFANPFPDFQMCSLCNALDLDTRQVSGLQSAARHKLEHVPTMPATIYSDYSNAYWCLDSCSVTVGARVYF